MMAVKKARACKRSRAWHRACWRERVAEWMDSGLSGVEYCRRHGLKPRSLYRWRRVFSAADGVDAPRDTPADKLGKAGSLGMSESTPVFAEVRVAGDGAAALGDGGVEVVLSGSRRLRVAPGFDSETLARAVRVLESLPC